MVVTFPVSSYKAVGIQYTEQFSTGVRSTYVLGSGSRLWESFIVAIADRSQAISADLAFFKREPCCMSVPRSTNFKASHLIRGLVLSDR